MDTMDGDFRDFVQNYFQYNGLLSKFSAELKSHIFNSMITTGKSDDNNDGIAEKSITNELINNKTNLDDLLLTDDGIITILLIHDMFDCLNLKYTNSVFKTETGCDYLRYKILSHNDLLEIFELEPEINNIRIPILYQIIMKYKTINKTLLKRLIDNTNNIIKTTFNNNIDNTEQLIVNDKNVELTDNELLKLTENCKILED